jgi:7,8-dihydropterin-6-yl-methyl-4-(beta-D-ribofuranosyl)aminobenzene 5'-phosphate synthase
MLQAPSFVDIEVRNLSRKFRCAVQLYSRREIIKKGGQLAAGTALSVAGLTLPGCSGDSANLTDLPSEALVPTALQNLKLTVLYDNNYYKEGLRVDWGFACLVEGLDHTILFDTGRHDTFLLSNLQALNVDPTRIDDIVISHKHMDHTGGLDTLVDMRIGKNIYLVKSLIFGLQGKLDGYGATLKLVDTPMVITKSALSTGSMKRVLISEQGLIVLTDRGAILVVGCSHPGIVEMVTRTRKITGMEVLLVVGGFHLLNLYAPEVEEIVAGLKEEGVRYVAPTHCTGTEARRIFAAGYGDHYLDCGVGRVITAGDLA